MLCCENQDLYAGQRIDIFTFQFHFNRKNALKEGFQQLSTDGVQVNVWPVDQNLEFSTWDFGGQQVFYPTHQVLIINLPQHLTTWMVQQLTITPLKVLFDKQIDLYHSVQCCQHAYHQNTLLAESDQSNCTR